MILPDCSFLVADEVPCEIHLHAGVEHGEPFVSLDARPKKGLPVALFVTGKDNLDALMAYLQAAHGGPGGADG